MEIGENHLLEKMEFGLKETKKDILRLTMKQLLCLSSSNLSKKLEKHKIKELLILSFSK
jgi:hypothetical protein